LNPFNYSEYCNEELFREFPYLLSIKKYLETFEDIQGYCKRGTAHAIYEDIFCNYVVDLFQKKESNHELLEKAFFLIEKIASHENSDTVNVAEVSFLEPLLDKIKPAKLVVPYLGKESLKLAKHTATQWYGWDADPGTWD
jgi:hypothetical protein